MTEEKLLLDKMIISRMHVIMVFIVSIGKLYGESGLHHILIEPNIYANGTTSDVTRIEIWQCPYRI